MTSCGDPRVVHVLLCVAHGSSTDDAARALVLQQVQGMTPLVPHQRTLTGFMRGTPSIADAVAQCQDLAHAGRRVHVTVLPVMTSAGHYCTRVLPQLLDEATAGGALTYTITRPIGAARGVGRLLHERAIRAAGRATWTPADTALLVIGHGTRRHAESRATALAHVRWLATQGWQSVHSAFIDDDPTIAATWATLRADRVIALPFLIGGGSHAVHDIPHAFGLTASPDGVAHIDGRALIVDAPLGTDARVAALGASIATRAWQRATRGVPVRTRGRVDLVGAGPGAPDLISLRGRAALQRADVVLYDRLIDPTILAMAPPYARLVDVGKDAATPQQLQHAINASLVAEAQDGHRVVRLKGGDPFVFGRGSEEVDACRAAGVRVRVVPGISSALAAPAVAGIPLTARQVSRGFAVVTAATEATSDETLAHLTHYAMADTLVVLMGRARLAAIVDLLQAAGRDADTPAACIERATLPGQRVVRGTLASIAQRAATCGLASPMVLVVGATAASRMRGAAAIARQALTTASV